jgi:hypothetical protein
MSEENPPSQSAYPALPCSTIVYRAALNSPSRDKVTGRILSGAFVRRGPKPDGTPRDVDGLSLSIIPDSSLSKDEIISQIRSQFACYAIASLHTGRVRDIAAHPGLDIVQDTPTR